MKEFNQNTDFDNLLKEKLSNIEVTPSTQLWDKIAVSIPNTYPAGTIFTPFAKIFLGSVAFVSVIVVSTLIYLYTDSELFNEPEKNETAIGRVEVQKEQFTFHSEQINTVRFAPQIVEQKENIFIPKTSSLQSTSEPVVNKTNIEQKNIISDSESTLKLSDISLSDQPIEVNVESIPPILGDLSYLDPTRDLLFTEKYCKPSPEYINTANISYNLYWQPEMVFYDKSLFSPDRSEDQSIGLTVMFSTEEFFFETGLAVTFLTRNNQYNNTTITNEMIGQYEQVDSVHFVQVWDPGTQSYITQPIYFTSLIPVYEHQITENITDKTDSYVYMQIPVMIGFKKPVKRFTFEAKTGFAYNSLIFTTQQNKIYSNEDINILQASQTLISYDRMKQYWSFIFGIGATYRMTNNAHFFITPTYRYLLTPLFSGAEPSRKSPYAFGVQTGIRFSFN